jgi:hypothetical protein
MQSVQQTYVFNQTNGAVTETVNGNWLQAYCEYLGVTQPVNSSWLQALCYHFGITQPLYGSWTIALANYYSITAPVNGTWWYALSQAGSPIPPVTDLIWDTTDTDWNLEEVEWLVATAPSIPTFDQEGDLLASSTPTLTGTADPTNAIILTIDGTTYNAVTDGLGVWSIPITTALPGAPGAGQNYSVDITAKDVGTGLETSIVGSVNILQTSKVITFEMRTAWALYWYKVSVRVEQETAPGTWSPIEIDGNPFKWQFSDYTGNQSFYKTDNFSSQLSGIYGIRYYQFDPSIPVGANQQTGPAKREITLDTGYNYRIVSQVAGSVTPNPGSNNYGRFCWYTVMDGATNILPEYPAGVNSDSLWDAGTIQQTFTL